MTIQEFLHKYPASKRPGLKRIVSEDLKISAEFLMMNPETCLSLSQEKRLHKKALDFLNHTPLSRILGYREFWSLKFHLSSATLDPRPDSETLIEAVLKNLPTQDDKNLSFLDLGTGTGCLIISLLSEYTHAQGTAVDRCKRALKTAKKNAELHQMDCRLKFIQSDWFEKVSGHFDVIISNPPYINPNEYLNLDDNVRLYDPKHALIAPDQGLAYYKKIIQQAPHFLNPRGLLVLEIGYQQKDSVSQLLQQHKFREIICYQDIEKRNRCLVATFS